MGCRLPETQAWGSGTPDEEGLESRPLSSGTHARGEPANGRRAPHAAQGHTEASTPQPGGVGGGRGVSVGRVRTCVLSWPVPRFWASSSRLPRASICHEFQPQTFPRQPQRKHPRPGAPPGPPCGRWLPSRRLGGRGAGRGLPALFGFPLPALEPQTPVSPRRRRILRKAQRPYSGAGEGRKRGPCARCTPGPHSTCAPALRPPPKVRATACPRAPRAQPGLLLVPEGRAASAKSPSLGTTWRKN